MVKPDITIIVCTYNESEMLSKALNCLFRQECDGKFSFDIVVVDDGSTDQTKDLLEEITSKSRAPIKCVHTQGKGISHARNRGVAESQGKWIAFFDQDQLADPGWLKELFAVASGTSADVVDGPRDLALSQEQLSQLSSVCRDHLGERKGALEPHKWNDRTPSCTGNVLISRRVFAEVGEFDESIVDGWEDWDFFRRVRAAGFNMWYAPKALVHHLIPPRRLTKGFFKWASLRVGNVFASRDNEEWGLAKTILACIARIVQALFVNMPILFWSFLIGNHAEIFGRKCLVMRAVGYTRKTLFLLAPRLFPQGRFFGRVEFRKEREIFSKETSLPEK